MAQALVRETEGNPFFVGEILRHLIETGAIVNDDGRWRGTVGVDEIGLPEGIRDVVGRGCPSLRRRKRDAAHRRRHRSGVPRARVEVTELSRRRVGAHRERDRRQAGERGQRHAWADVLRSRLVRSTLLEELSTTRRVRLHRRIGDALEGRPGTPAAELAHHFAEAATTGVADRAVIRTSRCRRGARSRPYDEAVRFTISRSTRSGPATTIPERASLLVAASPSTCGDEDAGRATPSADLGARWVTPRSAIGRAYQGFVGQWAAVADPVAVEMMEGSRDGRDESVREHARWRRSRRP